MKRYTLILLILLSFGFHLEGQEGEELIMDFEKYNPPSTLVVPEHIVTKAKYPFIDVHSHHWRMAEMDLDMLIEQMDAMNMGIVVNLSGRGAAGLKSIMDNVNAHHPKRIAVFTNINIRSIDGPDWTENTVKQIEFDVKNGAKGLKIYKSQGMFHKDKAGKRIPIDDSRIDPVWAKCGGLGIPVLIHAADPKSFWDPHDENNERWLELKVRSRRKRSATDPAP